MKKVVFTLCLVLFGMLTLATTSLAKVNGHGPINTTQNVCDTPLKEYNPGSSLCPGGECPYYIQVCVKKSNNSVIPSISYQGLPCSQASIRLFDDTINKNKPVSTKTVQLSCEASVSQTFFGTAVPAIGLHKYRAEIVTGPWGEGPTWVNEGDTKDITVPLFPAYTNRYYTPAYKINGHSYR